MNSFFSGNTDLKKETESLSDKVYRVLVNAILDGSLAPGTSLSEVDLSETLNVSRSPVREALFRLEAAGLIVRGRRSRVVSEIKPEDVIHNYELWEMIESFGVGLAVVRHTVEERTVIAEALEALLEYTNSGDVTNYRQANYHFHESLVAPCGNPVLLAQYGETIKRVKWASLFSMAETEEISRSSVSHSQIYEAYIARDRSMVEALVRQHIRDAAQRVVSKIQR